jgi:radical SAM protein with 4Fe4S-binding SPASM domain
MTEFLIRPETFGATVYDPRSLSYFFVNAAQLAALQPSLAVTPEKSVLMSSLMEAGTEADISGGNFARLRTALFNGSTLRPRPAPPPLPADSLVAPIRIYLEICLRCNANCKYCLNNAGIVRSNELSTEELLRTIKNFGRDGIFEVRLTGGEPTLRQDFFKLAYAVRQNGMALSVNSNLLVDKRMLKRLMKLRPDLLITSLDAGEEPHTKYRGKGYYSIVKNVRQLREARIPLRLNSMLNRDTLPRIEMFIDEFAPLGCGFCFILARPVGRGGAGFNPPPLSEMIPVVEMIKRKQQEYPEVYFSTSFHVVMEKELTIGGINLTGCNAIQKSFNVNSDGEVLPCAFLYELSPEAFSLGNIRHDNYSVLRIWRESELLRTLRRRSSECNLRCIGCPRFKNECLGTCIFMELYSERTGHPDPYCQLSMEVATQGLEHEM